MLMENIIKDANEKWLEKWFNFILRYSEKIDWKFLSINKNITLELVDKYLDKPWIWGQICLNENLTTEWIEKYPNRTWFWINILRNENLTIEWIDKYPNKPWKWDLISCNKNLTVEWIEKYPDKPWDWSLISRNQNLRLEWIEKYPDKDWNWVDIVNNKNITIDFIDKIADKIADKPYVWHFICQNDFSNDKENFLIPYINQYIEKKKYFNDNIFQELMEKIFHPTNINKFIDLGFDD